MQDTLILRGWKDKEDPKPAHLCFSIQYKTIQRPNSWANTYAVYLVLEVYLLNLKYNLYTFLFSSLVHLYPCHLDKIVLFLVSQKIKHVVCKSSDTNFFLKRNLPWNNLDYIYRS